MQDGPKDPAADRHTPWHPSAERDAKDPELAALLRKACFGHSATSSKSQEPQCCPISWDSAAGSLVQNLAALRSCSPRSDTCGPKLPVPFYTAPCPRAAGKRLGSQASCSAATHKAAGQREQARQAAALSGQPVKPVSWHCRRPWNLTSNVLSWAKLWWPSRCPAQPCELECPAALHEQHDELHMTEVALPLQRPWSGCAAAAC